jgi:hypothetical protein
MKGEKREGYASGNRGTADNSRQAAYTRVSNTSGMAE